jgi:hypothetical protein
MLMSMRFIGAQLRMHGYWRALAPGVAGAVQPDALAYVVG